MLLDYNSERSSHQGKHYEDTAQESKDLRFLDGNIISQNEHQGAKIIFNTLEEFWQVGGGRYTLSSVKQINTTDKFDHDRHHLKKDCQAKHTFSQCSEGIVLNFTTAQCGCAPLSLMRLETFQKV